MTPAQKTNAALTDVCRLLLDERELTPEQIKNLAADIPGECEEMRRTEIVIIERSRKPGDV